MIDIQSEDSFRTFVTGAPTLLLLSFINLIGNAVKFSSSKPVTVRYGTRFNKVKIEVIDRGIGIPAFEIHHILQPFYRASNTSEYKGTGIGMALAQRIINLHGGQLIIDSEVGSGTALTVYLDPEMDL